MYVLKYNLKYALESKDENLVSEKEKKQLRQIEKTSKQISRMYYVYAPIDLVATMGYFWRRTRSSTQQGTGFMSSQFRAEKMKSRYPLYVFLLSCRITGMYFATSEFSKMYLRDNAAPILKKCNPNR